MEGNSTKKVAANISARSDGRLYVGIKARRMLGVGFDDKVKVEIPEAGRVVEGALDSSGHISVGKEITDSVFAEGESRHGSTAHVDAIVKRATGTWDDDHELTEERHNLVAHLAAKLL